MAKKPEKEDDNDRYVRVHLAFGWWALAAFTLVGLVLEALHGLKIGWYLDVTSSTRRLSLTLGHAHGTLLALVNIAFALSLPKAELGGVARARASFALRAATVALPVGFLAGGFNFYGGDPGIAIILVPPSALLLLIGLVTFARGYSSKDR
jgi:hypothetical protein